MNSVLLSDCLAFRMSSSLSEGVWRALTVSKMVFECVSDACGPAHKGEVKGVNIPPCLISHDSAALPSAPSVALWGKKKARKDTEISVTVPNVGLNMETLTVAQL